MNLAILLLSLAAPASAEFRKTPVPLLEKLLAGRAEAVIAGTSSEGKPCDVELRRQITANGLQSHYAYGVAVIDAKPAPEQYRRYGSFYAYEKSFAEWEKVLKLADVASSLGSNDIVSLWSRGSRVEVRGEYVKPLFNDPHNPLRNKRPSGALTCMIETRGFSVE